MIRRLLAAIVRWAVDDELMHQLRSQEEAARTATKHLHRELHPLEDGWYAAGEERRQWWEQR